MLRKKKAEMDMAVPFVAPESVSGCMLDSGDWRVALNSPLFWRQASWGMRMMASKTGSHRGYTIYGVEGLTYGIVFADDTTLVAASHDVEASLDDLLSPPESTVRDGIGAPGSELRFYTSLPGEPPQTTGELTVVSVDEVVVHILPLWSGTPVEANLVLGKAAVCGTARDLASDGHLESSCKLLDDGRFEVRVTGLEAAMSAMAAKEAAEEPDQDGPEGPAKGGSLDP
jgi:hypothetical protein